MYTVGSCESAFSVVCRNKRLWIEEQDGVYKLNAVNMAEITCAITALGKGGKKFQF